MGVPHKHAVLIKAWADGAVIQFKNNLVSDFTDIAAGIHPSWEETTEYRIKPEPKPDVRRWANVLGGELIHYSDMFSHTHNLKLTFDGETGKLKSAEVIS